MAGVANEAFNYTKGSNEGIEEEEEEEEQIYDSIDEDSSETFSLSNNKELNDEISSIDLKTKSIKEPRDSNFSNGNGEGSSDKTESGNISAPQKLPIKQRKSTTGSSKAHSYDEITINFGKPVIHKTPQTSMLTKSGNNNNQDIFDSVCFTSPIEDIDKVIFRESSIDRSSSPLSDGNETSSSFYYEKPNVDNPGDGVDVNTNKPPPVPTPRTSLPKLRPSTEYQNIETSCSSNERISRSSESEGPYDGNDSA